MQAEGFGWGLGSWGGAAAGAITTTLDGALLDDTHLEQVDQEHLLH